MYTDDLLHKVSLTNDIPIMLLSEMNDVAGEKLLTGMVNLYDRNVNSAMNWFYTRNAAWKGEKPHTFLRPYDLCLDERHEEVYSLVKSLELGILPL